MKANELMIGDWVQCRDEFNEVTGPYEIDLISNDEIAFKGEVFARVFNNSIEPIPLTPEILEKNGFRYTNQHTLKGADTYVLCLEQRGFDFSITIKLNDYFALDSYDDRMYRLVEIQTGKWYVHDLQHALRMCGIDKSIEL